MLTGARPGQGSPPGVAPQHLAAAGAGLPLPSNRQHAMPGREPRLALATGAYAGAHPVVAVLADGDVIGIGAPEVSAPREALPGATTRRSQVTPAGTGARSGQ